MGLGLALHETDQLIDTHGVPLDDLIAVALLLFFGIRTLQVLKPSHILVSTLNPVVRRKQTVSRCLL